MILKPNRSMIAPWEVGTKRCMQPRRNCTFEACPLAGKPTC